MCVCVCVCESRIVRHGVFLYVLMELNTRHPRLAALEELTSCVDVFRPGYSQPKHSFRSDRLSSLGGRLGISRAGRLHRQR